MRTNEEQAALYEKWLEGRPPEIIALGRKFPPGSVISRDGMNWWMIGFREYKGQSPRLLVSPLNPADDYPSAVALAKPVCTQCMLNLAHEHEAPPPS